MTKNDHFETQKCHFETQKCHFETQKCHFVAFLASFKISFSSLQHPIYVSSDMCTCTTLFIQIFEHHKI